MNQKIILVDVKDREIGQEEKMRAHKLGRLHRAFSVFILNSKGQVMLQKRSREKYHCPGLWSNTCCSHPYPGETLDRAAKRRLKEEMGFTTRLWKSFDFIYRAEFDNGLIEHEFDHVFSGRFDLEPDPDEREVEDWRWAELGELTADIEKRPKIYTPWLKIIMRDHFKA